MINLITASWTWLKGLPEEREGRAKKQQTTTLFLFLLFFARSQFRINHQTLIDFAGVIFACVAGVATACYCIILSLALSLSISLPFFVCHLFCHSLHDYPSLSTLSCLLACACLAFSPGPVILLPAGGLVHCRQWPYSSLRRL